MIRGVILLALTVGAAFLCWPFFAASRALDTQGITLTGSIVGTRLDLAEVFQLHSAGRQKVVRTSRRLEDVNESMQAVEAGDIAALVVFDMRQG